MEISAIVINATREDIQLTGAEKLNDEKEKQVGLLMFLRNGHLCIAFSSKVQSVSSLNPLTKKSILLFLGKENSVNIR